MSTKINLQNRGSKQSVEGFFEAEMRCSRGGGWWWVVDELVMSWQSVTTSPHLVSLSLFTCVSRRPYLSLTIPRGTSTVQS